MINKFHDTDPSCPDDTKRMAVMNGWANFNGRYRDNFGIISQINSRLFLEQINANPDFSFAIELENEIQREAPELHYAMDELRRSLDKIVGWQIKWRHHERGEVLGVKYTEEQIPELSSEDVVRGIVRRGPAQYHEMNGWLVSSQVGPDLVSLSLNAWLEISESPYMQQGVHYSLAEMHAIELLPETNSS